MSRKGKYKVVFVGEKNHGKAELLQEVEKISSLGNKKQYDFFTCSKYEDDVRRMIKLVETADVVVIVVSAVDGPMVKTRQHILLSKQLGIENVIVFFSKSDKINDINEIEEQTKELVGDYYCDIKEIPFVRYEHILLNKLDKICSRIK